MANILFISVNDINAEGIRVLSANLIQKKHKASIVFLKRNGFPYNREKEYVLASRIVEADDWVGVDERGRAYRYSRGPEITEEEKKLLVSIIAKVKPDLIGFTVTTPLKKRISAVSRLIKREFSIPIIWGGAETTIDPSGCLEFCDYACVGEADQVILDIAEQLDKKEDLKKTNNLAYRENGRFSRNPLLPPIAELDSLPCKDIDPANKFLIDHDRLTENFAEISYSRNLNYHIISSRGCPNNCTYCCENFNKKLYHEWKFLRRRSPQHTIAELKIAKQTIDFKRVVFEDEVFSLDIQWLEEFKKLYLQEINLPFICYIYPNKNIAKQLEILNETGLHLTCLALQSGSDRINRHVFKRPFDKALYIHTAQILQKMKIDYYVDIITYNPFEAEEDLLSTLAVLKEIPHPYWLSVNKLFIAKNTEIYNLLEEFNRKKEQGRLTDDCFGYYTRLFFLSRFSHFGKHLVAFIQKKKVFRKFPRLLNMMILLVAILKTITKKIPFLNFRSNLFLKVRLAKPNR